MIRRSNVRKFSMAFVQTPGVQKISLKIVKVLDIESKVHLGKQRNVTIWGIMLNLKRPIASH